MIILGKICKIGNKVIDKIVNLIIILMILCGALGIYDAYSVYSKAGVSDNVYKFKPEINDSKENPTLLELIKVNPDVVAWLTINDTNIDYPVLQGSDNEKYLNYTLEGDYALSGSIFLDYLNSKDFTDKYSLIYGHHMAGEVMFGAIPNFQEEDFFKKHTKGNLFLMDKTYDIEIFGSIFTTAFDTKVFKPSFIKSDRGLKETINYIRTNAKQFREIDWKETDTLIGFSTCYSSSTDGRVIVFGRLREVS